MGTSNQGGHYDNTVHDKTCNKRVGVGVGGGGLEAPQLHVVIHITDFFSETKSLSSNCLGISLNQDFQVCEIYWGQAINGATMTIQYMTKPATSFFSETSRQDQLKLLAKHPCAKIFQVHEKKNIEKKNLIKPLTLSFLSFWSGFFHPWIWTCPLMK